jgi:flagellar L-ring protein precursor FlgH
MMIKVIILNLRRYVPLLALAGILAGCAFTPATSVHQPLSTRPAPLRETPQANGAIYQTGYGERPLFEDRRARQVGDTLTIVISERTNASKKSNTNTGRSSTNTFGVTALQGLPGKSFLGANLNANSDFSFDGKGESASANDFTGTITVTVIEVLGNGNFVVSGEKQIGINQGSEFVRLSGVVNPTNLTIGNTVLSTQVADARIEFRANETLNDTQRTGWLARFFLNVLPF